ncbi:hypothetical protein RZS08_42725 [Arthrospira platensis SPKY1]|nr:hypothetical protein [Arthrospira platensis SPKY1]
MPQDGDRPLPLRQAQRRADGTMEGDGGPLAQAHGPPLGTTLPDRPL